jgi:hypothetical protein
VTPTTPSGRQVNETIPEWVRRVSPNLQAVQVERFWEQVIGASTGDEVATVRQPPPPAGSPLEDVK